MASLRSSNRCWGNKFECLRDGNKKPQAALLLVLSALALEELVQDAREDGLPATGGEGR